MRPGQNKRMRGRNNNSSRKGPNPLTRSYESNGPDVKIRGTAHHVGEKYLQLARDAHSAGDPVRAESYLQHAEHYFRVIAAAQQTQHGYGRQLGDQTDYDEDGDDDDGGMPDRFASPAERPVQQPYADRQGFQNQQGYQGGNGGERRDGQGYGQGERSYDNRNGRSYDNRGNQDRGGQDRSYQGQGHSNSGHGNHGNGAHGTGSQGNSSQGNNGQGNNQGYGSQANGGQGQGGQITQGQSGHNNANHSGAGQTGNGHDRNAGQRSDGERASQGERQPQHDRGTRDYSRDRESSRDYDNRQRGPRPPRPAVEARQPEEPINGLPAFITAPTRVSTEQGAHQSESPEQAVAQGGTEDGMHLRPRRRRRSKAEFADRGGVAGGDGETRQEPQAAPAASEDASDD